MPQAASEMMVQQGEGGAAVKSRRNGARLFKNPPQPHMCIQDYIQGSWDPCYVNVLSWGKIAMPHRPSEPVPLWGGMRVSPPRTEKPQCAVFAVMVNPEILRLNGKNAQDPQERSVLIDLLLDFVEAMNEGVIFTRCYTVLKDRDITGELKEVWMAVQMKRDREQETQQETWIDVQPPAPQYPQFEMTPEYSYQTNNDQVQYQTGHIVTQQYHANVPPQISQEQYNYGERGRGQQQQNSSSQQQNCPAYPTPQYQYQQQLAGQQLLPQYINSNIHPNAVSVNPNYSNQTVVNSNVNPNIPGHYQQYIALQQQMVGQRQLENVMHAVRETHGDIQIQGQQQPPPSMQLSHIQSIPQYEQSPPFSLQNSLQMNVLRLGRPHMGITQKSNANNRQNNSSPTHSKQLNSANIRHGNKDGAEKSPNKCFRMRILRDPAAPSSSSCSASDKINPGLISMEKIKAPEINHHENSSGDQDKDIQNIQVTDLDEELEARSGEEVREFRDFVRENKNLLIKSKKDLREQILNSSDEITVLESNLPLEGTEDDTPKQDLSSKTVKTQILVLKRNSNKTNSSVNDSKMNNGKDGKLVKNAIRLTKLEGQQIYDLESETRIAAELRNKDKEIREIKDKNDEQGNSGGIAVTADKKLNDNNFSKNGYTQYNKKQDKKQERHKRFRANNNIVRNNVGDIQASTSNENQNQDKDKEKSKSKSKIKVNGGGKAAIDNDEVYHHHGYAILRKSKLEMDKDDDEDDKRDIVSEIAQISIQDCGEMKTTESNNSVHS